MKEGGGEGRREGGMEGGREGGKEGWRENKDGQYELILNCNICVN